MGSLGVAPLPPPPPPPPSTHFSVQEPALGVSHHLDPFPFSSLLCSHRIIPSPALRTPRSSKRAQARSLTKSISPPRPPGRPRQKLDVPTCNLVTHSCSSPDLSLTPCRGERAIPRLSAACTQYLQRQMGIVFLFFACSPRVCMIGALGLEGLFLRLPEPANKSKVRQL